MKNKRILVITVCVIVLLITSCLAINNQEIKPPRLYLSSEFSKTIQTVQGGYSWSRGNESVIADSIHPTEFQYDLSNTLTVERSSQLILSNKKMRFDRRYPFELLTFECFDKDNKTVENYKVFPTYSNGDLYINAPSENGVYICSVILKYGQNTAGYGYKLVVADDETRALSKKLDKPRRLLGPI